MISNVVVQRMFKQWKQIVNDRQRYDAWCEIHDDELKEEYARVNDSDCIYHQ